MKTKQKIINQAIKTYNEQGVTNVTSRNLAETLGMSHGNLEYHFPNKEVLIKAIYKQMRSEVSGLYEVFDTDSNPIYNFNELLKGLEALHNKYSFFNLDLLEISRNFKEVDDQVKKTLELRKKQTAHFFNQFIAYGYFKDEMFEGMYMRLQHSIRILITFWKSQEEILPKFFTINNGDMAMYIWELLIPHMTEKGVAAYHEFVVNA